MTSSFDKLSPLLRSSVAEVVKPKVYFPNLRAQPRSRENIVVAYPPTDPKDGPRDASVETKKRLYELMKPKDDLMLVRNMRPISKGGVLVEAAFGQAAGMFVENQALKTSGFMVSWPKVVLPKVMNCDVLNDISEEKVRNCLMS